MSRLFSLAVAMMATLPSLEAQTPTDAPRVPTMEHRLDSRLELEQFSAPDAARAVLKQFKQPGGIVASLPGECISNPRVSWSLPAGLNLGGGLDLIIPAGSPWLWTMDKSVVNIMPREKLPELMSVRIVSFQWNTRDLVRVVMERLFAMDSVTGFLAKRRISSGIQSIVELSQAPPVGGVRVESTGQEYSITDSTLLGALNRVVASYGNAVWVYAENHCGGKSEYNISAN